MAKAGFVDDLTRSIAVLPQGTQLTLSSPEQSKMNAPDGVHLLAEELSKKYYDLPVRHIGFDRTHNGHAANPALFGEIVKRSLADYSHLPYFDMPW